MNEFALIDHYFKPLGIHREDVIFGIGDDAACLNVPADQHLLVSTDTLVAEVHFLSTWDPYDIAYKSAMVNYSDIAAMGALPCWLSLALTLPKIDNKWLSRFSQGLNDCLKYYQVDLIGGDTTRGPLSITISIFGLVPKGKAVRRKGAKPGDRIYVTGMLGAAALAVHFLKQGEMDSQDNIELLEKLKHPKPRLDFATCLQACASAAIDLSDGLSADLNHILEQSQVGACLYQQAIPIHPLVKKYQLEDATQFALTGGDDYELCFTVPEEKEKKLIALLEQFKLSCYPIGIIEEEPGLRMLNKAGNIILIKPCGYSHF